MILGASCPTGSPTLPVLVRDIPPVVELLDPCVVPAAAVCGAADIPGGELVLFPQPLADPVV